MNRPLETILKRHEGLDLRPYRDRNGWAVGYGHQIEPEDWMERIASGQSAVISPAEAEALFASDVARAERWRERIFAGVVLSPARRDALTAMIYQLGPGGVLAFRRMRQAIARGDWAEAAREALDSQWAAQTPRRAMEMAEMLRDDRYPSEPP